MNKLCEICDTRNRLGICKGRDGDFKYCFRRVGTIRDLAETITPFNTLHELYEKCEWLHWVVPETLELDSEPYGRGNIMVLLWGQSERQLGTREGQPVGYVTANVTDDMKVILYSEEV